MHATPRQRGFTIVELMIVIVIAGILLAIAAPSMTDAIERGSVMSKARELRITLGEARALSIDRALATVVCASADGEVCGGDWSEGWLTFVDEDNNGALDAGENIIKVYGGFSDKTELNTAAASIRFIPGSGELNAAAAADFVICPPSAKASYARGVVVQLSGIVRYARDSDGDGLLEDSNGDAYAC